MEQLFIPLALVAGALLAVQAGANAQLSKATGSPFAATTLQLSVGTALLAGLTILTGALGALALLPHATWWHLVGGTASAFYVVSTILLFPRLGAVVSVGLFIAGQMLASLVLDTGGLLGVAPHPLTYSSMIGAMAVFVGAAVIVAGQAGLSSISTGNLGWIVLALLAGAVLPIQGAVNALLRADLQGAAAAVGVVSFLIATLAMVAASVVALALPDTPRPTLDGVSAMPWWGWLGGFAGAIYVTTVFTALPVIGAAATVGLTVAGQQVASVFVDKFGWFRLPKRPVSGIRLLGVGLLLAGVAAMKLG